MLWWFIVSALGVEDEDEGEEEEDEEDPEEYDDNPVPVEPAKKAKDAGTTAATSSGSNKNNTPATSTTTTTSSAIDYKDDVVVPPKVSPVAASPSSGKPPSSSSAAVDDDEDDDNFDGSGGSGAGTGSNADDEDEDETDYDDPTDEDVVEGGIDINSVITEPVPKEPVKPEKKPEVVVQTPPTTSTKAPKESAPSSPPPGRDENQVPAEPMTTPAPGPIDPALGPDGNRGHNDVQILDHKPDDRQASFFAQPGILAGKFIKHKRMRSGAERERAFSSFVSRLFFVFLTVSKKRIREGKRRRPPKSLKGNLGPVVAAICPVYHRGISASVRWSVLLLFLFDVCCGPATTWPAFARQAPILLGFLSLLFRYILPLLSCAPLDLLICCVHPPVPNDNLKMFFDFVYSCDRWSRCRPTLRHSARHVHRLPHAQEGRRVLRSRRAKTQFAQFAPVQQKQSRILRLI